REAFRTVLAAPSADPTRQMTEPEPAVPPAPADGAEADVSAPGDPGDPVDLPLVEVPATVTSGPVMAIHLTGDGGWGVTDKGIARELAAAGVPVVGWNSLRYFWQRRDPDEATRDLARVMRHYLTAWDKQKVILIGYSFGADVLPIMFNRLPFDLQARVPEVVLLGPSAEASFEFHLGDWFGRHGEDAVYPVAQEIVKIPQAKVFCFYGADDKDAICGQLDPARVTSVAMNGGHRIGGRFDGIVKQILEALP
ncbi:MAG: AcvB/VirJ family lysyl-phosphatidylglycerol hydrolase, partial [Candidatus Krumholzibacteriia bacterium]